MSVNKITNVYATNNKEANSSLESTEWNAISAAVNTAHTKINEVIDNLGTGGSGSSEGSTVSGDSHITMNAKGNLTIETTAADMVNSKGGKINIEPVSDLQIKPGDDISLYAHHRTGKEDEVSVKILSEASAVKAGSPEVDCPVKLQVNASELVLTTKDKELNPKYKADESYVMDVTVNSAQNTRGYLKVRAAAIDLRCEKHGGVALQPKGFDSDGNMNKIKFEHGGGDGLEFGTFNTEKSSLFTDEYRFKKDGVWKMATRQTVASGKTIKDETESGTIPAGKAATGALKYVKQADDFYDIIDNNDEQCTTKDIIKTAYALNGGKDRHVKITNKGAVEIATNATYSVTLVTDATEGTDISTISTEIAAIDTLEGGEIFNDGDFETSPTADVVYTNGTQYWTFTTIEAPAIKIDSGGGLKLGGILDFGSTFNYGETDGGIEYQYKLTKKGNTKDCGILRVVGVNNHASDSLTVEGITIAPGTIATIAECSVLDIIKLVNYMKTNTQGPWAE